MIFPSPPLQMPTQTLTPSSPPPTTTGGHRKPLLLVVKPPNQEEHCNRSGILLKDSVEKIPPILHFVPSLR
ncbi:hypothetical protein HKD37_15G043421 [Glycine soja]